MNDEMKTETADVIDLPVRKEQVPIPAVLLEELRRLQAARAALEQQLGRLVTDHDRGKTDLVAKIAAAESSFSTRARDALLCAGADVGAPDDKTAWDVDLREGVIRRA